MTRPGRASLIHQLVAIASVPLWIAFAFVLVFSCSVQRTAGLGPVAALKSAGLTVHAYDTLAARALATLGTRQVRTTVSWDEAVWSGYPDRDARFERDVGNLRRLHDAGLDVLAVISYPPHDMTAAQGAVSLASFAARVVRAVPVDVQPLNECDAPDVPWCSDWYRWLSTDSMAGLYAAMVSRVTDSVHAACPSCRVVTMGISTDDVHAAFVKALVRRHARYDVLAVHDYHGAAAIGPRYAAIRGAGETRPVWLTEFGSTIADDAVQRADLSALLAAYDASGFARAYVYALIDGSPYGIMRADGSLRPAAQLLGARSR